MDTPSLLLLTRSDVRALMTFPDYLTAMEQAFRMYAEGHTLVPGLLHVEAPAGEFHIKAGGLVLDRTYFAIKANGGFFQNRTRFGLPNIQGVIVLFDGDTGSPLALLDSIEITVRRTAATVALAAQHLARHTRPWPPSAAAARRGGLSLRPSRTFSLTFAGPLPGTTTAEVAAVYAQVMAEELDLEVMATEDCPQRHARAISSSPVPPPARPSSAPNTSARVPSLRLWGPTDPDKQELEPALLADSMLVVECAGAMCTAWENCATRWRQG